MGVLFASHPSKSVIATVLQSAHQRDDARCASVHPSAEYLRDAKLLSDVAVVLGIGESNRLAQYHIGKVATDVARDLIVDSSAVRVLRRHPIEPLADLRPALRDLPPSPPVNVTSSPCDHSALNASGCPLTSYTCTASTSLRNAARLDGSGV
jgi:hypothetical protein